MLINVCRVCGRSTLCPKAQDLFKPGRQETLRRIQMITGIRLQQIPNAPDMVCFCCQTDLNSAMIFRRQCILEQKKWVPVEKAEEVEQNQEGEPKDPVPKKRRNPQRKARSKVPLKIVEVLIKAENNAMVNAKGGDEEFDQLTEISREPDATDGDVNLDDSDVILDENDDKDDELRLVDKDFKRRRKVQIHKCQTCGAVKNNKSSLARHEFGHTGERPFPCKECTKTFLSGNELKAHNLTNHTKEPPFPCRYCERRYFSVIGRKKHERIHTNERPFVCDQCGKAFTRTCILKAHMESHAVIKKFSCDVCDRSFSLKKHLMTHFISNTHKRNSDTATLSSSESMSMFGTETDETWSQSTDQTSLFNEELVQSHFDILCQEI
ncbi:transcription factor Ouib [Drosophila ficusphila]|uniref:transcription factor Ouib n=1 Tax=Drosophila ficusphila TaxID=30025 RepID=UPI0007E84174|nr:transcription factor Ouib [Drosophila ficusphila]